MLNLNNPDPVKNEVVNNLDFRIGLSLAVNRQEIIDLIYLGLGTSGRRPRRSRLGPVQRRDGDPVSPSMTRTWPMTISTRLA